ncbi:prepilin peptidase [candidate division KSB1 bacterium]|nr:prepilin peptidase [candidate division KSB1 bacterium]
MPIWDVTYSLTIIAHFKPCAVLGILVRKLGGVTIYHYLIPIMMYALLFTVGVVIGSFLNGCMSRFPLKKSITVPRLQCPACGVNRKFYECIPIISYLCLKGKCADCNAPIPKRYVVVEMISGGLLIALYRTFQLQPLFFMHALFCFCLIVIAGIDIETKRIPDKITLPGIAAGLILSIFNDEMTLKNATIRMSVGGGLLLCVAFLGILVYRKESMGGGDVKLAAMVGSFLGVQGIVLSLLAAFIVSAIVGSILLSIKRIEYIPFGPFIAFGAFFYLFSANAAWFQTFTSILPSV